MADLERLMTDHYLNAQAPEDEQSVMEVINLLERAFGSKPDSIESLIAVGFVECMPSTGESGVGLRDLLGPSLWKEYGQLNW
jgi:hypothetical protein